MILIKTGFFGVVKKVFVLQEENEEFLNFDLRFLIGEDFGVKGWFSIGCRSRMRRCSLEARLAVLESDEEGWSDYPG